MNLYVPDCVPFTIVAVKAEKLKLSICALVHMAVDNYFWIVSWLTRISNLQPSNVQETVQNIFQYSMKPGKIQ